MAGEIYQVLISTKQHRQLQYRHGQLTVTLQRGRFEDEKYHEKRVSVVVRIKVAFETIHNLLETRFEIAWTVIRLYKCAPI